MAPILLRYRNGRLPYRSRWLRQQQQGQVRRQEQARISLQGEWYPVSVPVQHVCFRMPMSFEETFGLQNTPCPCHKLHTSSHSYHQGRDNHDNATGIQHRLARGIGRLISMTLHSDDQGCKYGMDNDHDAIHCSPVMQNNYWRPSSFSLKDEIVLQTFCNERHLDRAVDALCLINAAPSKSVYASLLRLCGKRKSLKQLKRVHAHLFNQGLELDHMLGDHLVVALANCGALDDACELLYKLPHYTVHSWTAIVSAYMECVSAHDALLMYKQMQQCGVVPSSYTFVILFKACSSIPDLRQGKDLHSEAHKRGFTDIIFVDNSLLSMYGKCGAIQEAEHVFSRMLQHDVVSWNSMIAIYIQNNKGRLALLLYRQMQAEGVDLDQHTLVFALQACVILVSKDALILRDKESIKLAPFEIGQAFHADAAKKKLSSDVFVGTALCGIYAKTGYEIHTENVFTNLCHPDIISWNAMLSAYIEQGQGEKALLLFKQMQIEGMSPNELTFVISLKACGTIAEKQGVIVNGCASGVLPLQIGRALHADALIRDVTSSSFLRTGILNMYGKCGAVLEAEHLFSTMSECDIVSWNVVISTYIQQGQGVKALLLYRQMQEESVHFDQHTLVSGLQACGILAEKEEASLVEGQAVKVMPLEIGQALHAQAYRKGLAFDVYVSNTLVSMYGKCGTMTTAEIVFSDLSKQDPISWNSMLTAYIQLGLVGKALQSYQQMLEREILPDQLTFVILLQACGILAEKDEARVSNSQSTKQIACKIGQALHKDIWKRGFVSDVQVVNTLISVYGKCGTIHEAELAFLGSPHNGVVSWTAMLSAYVEQLQGVKALQMYSQMQGEGMSPNHLTFVIALQACGIMAEREEAFYVEGRSFKAQFLVIGEALHTEAVLTGYDSEMLVGTLLVTMYGKCGAIVEAEDIFCALPYKDVNVWNAMLSIYVAQGKEEDAVHLYSKLKMETITVDDVTYLSILQACSETGSLEICNEIHFLLVSAGYDRISSMATTIIHTYGSCASVRDVDVLFDALPSPDVVSLTACISQHAGGGSLTASEQVLETVRFAGMKPDGVLFTSILSACNHTGFVVEGLEYFASMSQDYGIRPTLRHVSTVVNLLGRSGNFSKLVHVLERMPTQDDLSFWMSLLGACRLHSNMELAEQAFGHAVKLHPEQASSYILMSNVYAEAEFQACMNVIEN